MPSSSKASSSVARMYAEIDSFLQALQSQPSRMAVFIHVDECDDALGHELSTRSIQINAPFTARLAVAISCEGSHFEDGIMFVLVEPRLGISKIMAASSKKSPLAVIDATEGSRDADRAIPARTRVLKLLSAFTSGIFLVTGQVSAFVKETVPVGV